MRHVSAEMLSAGLAALRPYRRRLAGLIAFEAERAPEALASLFRAMAAIPARTDPTAAERQRRYRARKLQGRS